MKEKLMSNFTESAYWHSATGLPEGVFAGQTLAFPNLVNIDEDTQWSVSSVQSAQNYGQQNMGLHVGDDTRLVQQHRIHLLQQLQPYGVKCLQWLNQTHSTTAYVISDMPILQLLDGDGLVTNQQGVALMMMTADCLPIVVSNTEGTEIACLHAGWRGLANGIIAATLAKMQTQPAVAWIGAAISQPHFEVGAEVRDIFVAQDKATAQDFIIKENGKYLGDLYAIARRKLQACGVAQITGGNRCSFAEPEQFYSYRRQAQTGRMATFIFIAAKDATLN